MLYNAPFFKGIFTLKDMFYPNISLSKFSEVNTELNSAIVDWLLGFMKKKRKDVGSECPMVQKVVGEVTCVECGATYNETKMMDIGSDDSYGSLIWCDKCGWVRWS